MVRYPKTKAEWQEIIDDLDGIYEEYNSVWDDNVLIEAVFHGWKDNIFGIAARSCEERASDMVSFISGYLSKNEVGGYRILVITCVIHAFAVLEYTCHDETGVTETCYRAYDSWLRFHGDFSFDILGISQKVDWLITVYDEGQ